MISLFKKYSSNYTGISLSAWHGVIAGFIESTLVGVCYFLSIYFIRELHLTISKAGIIMSCYGAGTIFGGMFGGKLSDVIFPRTISIISLCIQAVAYFLLIKVKIFSLLMLNLFIIGIGSYGFITSNHAWTLAQCKQNERLKTINLLDVVSNLGLALSGLIISCISTKYFAYIFCASSSLLLIMAISIFATNRNNFVNTSYNETIKVSDSSNSKLIYIILIFLFIAGFIISQMNSTYPAYLLSLFPEMGNQSFGILFTLNAFLIVLFQSPIVNWMGNFNKIISIGLGIFLLGLGMLILNFVYVFWIAILSCILITIGEILFFSMAQLVCYEKAAPNKKGHSLGYYRTVYAASRVAGPFTGGMIYQYLNGKSLWIICFTFGLTCFLMAYSMKKID